MPDYEDYDELKGPALRAECKKRNLTPVGIKKEHIEQMVQYDEHRRVRDRQKHTNETDPLGKKRLAQAKEEHDWSIHAEGNKGRAHVRYLKEKETTTRNKERAAYEADAKAKKKALDDKLKEIQDAFGEKVDAINADVRAAQPQLRAAEATPNAEAASQVKVEAHINRGMRVSRQPQAALGSDAPPGSASAAPIDLCDSDDDEAMSTTNTVVGPKVSSSQGVNSVSRPQNRQSHLQGHHSTSNNPNNPMCLPPYLFLNKKFLPMTPHSCQTLEEAMESEISAEYPGTTFVQPTVRHNEKGYFIGNLSNVELRKLHKTLNGKVLFGKFGQRATSTLIPRQKDTHTHAKPQIRNEHGQKREANPTTLQPSAKRQQVLSKTEPGAELIDYDIRPRLKGTPQLYLIKRDLRTGPTLRQVKQAHRGITHESSYALWAKGTHKGIFVAFENSEIGKAEVRRIEGMSFIEGFHPAFRP